MNSNFSYKQAQRDDVRMRYQAHIAQSHNSEYHEQKVDIQPHELRIIHIGRIYPVRDWRVFITKSVAHTS